MKQPLGPIGSLTVPCAGSIKSALALPYERRVRWFGGAVERVVAPLAGYRTRAEAQLELIWPEMDAPERRALARSVCNNFGRTMIENYSAPPLPTKFKARPSAAGGSPRWNRPNKTAAPFCL